MAAVAHSPSFAKKVGVPQSVGKDFTAADKGKKFMNPRARSVGGNIKKMNNGGETGYDNMSFGAAWRAARKDKGAGEVFTYKGKDYSTNTEEEGVGMRRQIPREGKDTSETGPSRGALGKSRAGKTEEPISSKEAEARRNMSDPNYREEGAESVGLLESLIPVGKLAGATALARKALPKLFSKMGKITSGIESRAAAKAAEEAAENTAKRSSRLSKPLKEAKADADKARLERIAKYEDEAKEAYRGMRTGGKVDKVKAYAKGGSVRGGGCESKGKTKGKFR